MTSNNTVMTSNEMASWHEMSLLCQTNVVRRQTSQRCQTKVGLWFPTEVDAARDELGRWEDMANRISWHLLDWMHPVNRYRRTETPEKRETDRQIHWQTHRHKDRVTGTRTDRAKGRHALHISVCICLLFRQWLSTSDIDTMTSCKARTDDSKQLKC